MWERARPLAPDQRREALVDATLPLLYVHGRNVTTRLIAEAAGVAEGTIFRAFESKDELVDAAIRKAFAPGNVIRRLDDIEPDWTLERRLMQVVMVIQQRLLAMFGLMKALGLVAPPFDDPERQRAFEGELSLRIIEIIGADADRLRVSPDELQRLLWLLTFAGSHRELADGKLLKPEEIVDVVLHGVIKENR